LRQQFAASQRLNMLFAGAAEVS